MTKEQCIELIGGKLRGRAVLMLEAGYDPDFVCAYLKGKEYKTLSGVPPLTFKANGKNLINYRIYGNTVNGESVGDRTGNLFDYTTMSGTNGVRLNSDGSEIQDSQWSITDYIPCDGLVFTINKIGGLYPAICLYDASKTFIVGKAYNTPSAQTKTSVTISSNAPAKYIRFSYFISNDYPLAIDDLTKIMLNEGSTALPYEPYGCYRVPVTVSDGTDTQTTNLYLPEQIKKVGSEEEYVDYGQQKKHRVRKNLFCSTLSTPAYDGVSMVCDSEGVITLNGTSNNGSYVNLAFNVSLPVGTYILTGGSEMLTLRFQKSQAGYAYDDSGDGRVINCAEPVTQGVITMKFTANYTYENFNVYPMIRKSSIDDDTFEPYIEDTELDVTLPTITTLNGTNVVSVGTAVQPSKVEIKYKR